MELNGILFFIIVILAGYLALRLKLVPAAAADVLPPLLLNVCFPAMLFLTFAQTGSDELLQAGLPTVIVTLVFTLLPFLASFPLFRNTEDSRRALLRYISGIGNTSFVCIPLLSLFLEGSALAIVFVHGAVMDLLIWGLHHQIFAGSAADSRLLLKNVLATPNLIAVVAGLLCSAFQIQVPDFLLYTLEGLSATVSPLSLLFIGMLICQYGLWGWLRCKTAMYYTVWKVLLLPAAAFAVLYFLLPLDMACILAILLGSPAPVSAVLWCKQYGRDTRLAVNCLIPSTLLYFAVYGAVLVLLTKFGIL